MAAVEQDRPAVCEQRTVRLTGPTSREGGWLEVRHAKALGARSPGVGWPGKECIGVTVRHLHSDLPGLESKLVGRAGTVDGDHLA